MIQIPDHDTFGMHARLDLWLPTNLLQHIALWRARRELSDRETSRTALLATCSLAALNRYARRQHGDFRTLIYDLKSDMLRCLSAHGYVMRVDAEQQIIRCNYCDRGVWHRGSWNADWCYRCEGTGIHRRVLLYRFLVRGDRFDFVFHQPSDRASWAAALVTNDAPIEKLPKYKALPAEIARLSSWELQLHLLRVAHFVASRMWFEQVHLCDWRAAAWHDLKEVANHIWRRLRTIFVVKEELPF